MVKRIIEGNVKMNPVDGKKNKNLNNAKSAKQDEFYTQLTDVEKELKHYKNHFNGKVVFCNCDDPRESNFFKYFYLKFKSLGLKKLISTHYDATMATYKSEYDGETYVETPLVGNGDFRSEESIALLKEADIVVTNPPFSLFREYVAQLMEYEKKFLIIGSKNAIKYKEMFPLFRDNKLWVGVMGFSTDMLFIAPIGLDTTLKPKTAIRTVDGIVYLRSPSIWFTNLEIKKRYEDMLIYKTYNEKDYPSYDNYDAINVDKTKDIPCDYYGAMGVPITFMDKYNPNQFELIAHHGYPLIGDKNLYSRLIIKRRVN